MKKFEVYVAADLEVTLDARDAQNASDKATYVTDTFFREVQPYKLNLPGVGAVTVRLIPVEAEADEDLSPEVFEVKEAATTDQLGALPSGYAQEFPLGGTLRGEEWNA